jgi:hypothetical protein
MQNKNWHVQSVIFQAKVSQKAQYEACNIEVDDPSI